jgi:hypothetical protein
LWIRGGHYSAQVGGDAMLIRKRITVVPVSAQMAQRIVVG